MMMLHILPLIFFILSYSSLKINYAQRIVGGQAARAGQFPFAAAIHVVTDDSNFFCGGTLLNVQWVITAAQCVHRATLVTLQLGSNHLNSPDPNRITLASSEFIIHPDFNPVTLENDVGLIRLRLPIQLTDSMQPIHSLPANTFKPEYGALATGWGHLSDEDFELTDELQYVLVSSVSNDECKITFGNQIKDTMLCVVGSYNEGICLGDTGGPLVELIKMGNGCLAGIASFISANGCESTDPSGYTRIHPYVSWIKNITAV